MEWVLPVSVNEALVKWPELKKIKPMFCGCGRKIKPKKVVTLKDFIGFESEECYCGSYDPVFVAVPRSKRAKSKWLKLLQNVFHKVF